MVAGSHSGILEEKCRPIPGKLQSPLIVICMWGWGRVRHVSKLDLDGKAHLEGRKEPQEGGTGRAWARTKEKNQGNSYESAGPGNRKNSIHVSSFPHSLLLPKMTVFLGKLLTNLCLKTMKGQG